MAETRSFCGSRRIASGMRPQSRQCHDSVGDIGDVRTPFTIIIHIHTRNNPECLVPLPSGRDIICGIMHATIILHSHTTFS